MSENGKGKRRRWGSDAGEPSSNRRHTRHISTACNHCRKSKGRCDGEHPVCGPCTLRGSDCHWTVQLDKRRAVTKEEMDEVNAHIRRLEDELAQVTAENNHMRDKLSALSQLDVQEQTRGPSLTISTDVASSSFSFSAPVSPMLHTHLSPATGVHGDYLAVPGWSNPVFTTLRRGSLSSPSMYSTSDGDAAFSESSGFVSSMDSPVITPPESAAYGAAQFPGHDISMHAVTGALGGTGLHGDPATFKFPPSAPQDLQAPSFSFGFDETYPVSTGYDDLVFASSGEEGHSHGTM